METEMLVVVGVGDGDGGGRRWWADGGGGGAIVFLGIFV